MTNDKETMELILAEIIKINNRLNNLENKMDQGFLEMSEHITFIGKKVFDNHEIRIAKLEAQ